MKQTLDKYLAKKVRAFKKSKILYEQLVAQGDDDLQCHVDFYDGCEIVFGQLHEELKQKNPEVLSMLVNLVEPTVDEEARQLLKESDYADSETDFRRGEQ